MTIRYTDENGNHKIVEVTELELEGVENTSVKNGVWTFKVVTE